MTLPAPGQSKRKKRSKMLLNLKVCWYITKLLDYPNINWKLRAASKTDARVIV